MRIGLDARTLFARQARGTGRNLRDAIRQLATARPADEFLLYHRPLSAQASARSDGASGDWCSAGNVRLRPIDCPGDRLDLWMHVRLPMAAWGDRVDVLHMPANAVPWRSPVPVAATIHDLIPLTSAGDGDARAARRFARGVHRALRTAARIITPSEFTRNELISRFAANRDRISVVPWAPDTSLARAMAPAARASEDGRIRAAFGLRGSWILNFSGRSRRKNPYALVEAFAAIPAAIRGDTVLVLSGCEPAQTRARLDEAASRLGVAEDCRFLGFLPECEAGAMLRGATGLAMPSLAEGFGLPVLDAMACGVPVLASARTSLEEVAGDAAIYVDPRSVESIRDGLVELIEGRQRARRVEIGKERAAGFTWERTAAGLADVYEQCIRGPTAHRALRRAVHPAPEGAA